MGSLPVHNNWLASIPVFAEAVVGVVTAAYTSRYSTGDIGSGSHDLWFEQPFRCRSPGGNEHQAIIIIFDD